MALNVTNLMTVIGKYVKTINTWNGYITTLESQKDEIYGVLDTAGLQDLYVDVPSQFEGFKDAVASWISTAIGEVEDLLTDEAYVLEELPIFSSDVTSVLNAIFDKMVADSDSLKASIVTLGSNDTDQFHFTPNIGGTGTSTAARVFLTRTLDGVSAPSSLVSAHTSYNNEESQLAMSCDIFAKVVSSSQGAETLQLFADSPTQASYTSDAESPGTGPTISNLESSISGITNYDFSAWSGDNPTGWTITGGSAGTDWIDKSTTGDGPLELRTAGVTVKQQVTGLSRRTMYFFGALIRTQSATPANSTGWKMRIENVDGLTVHKNFPNLEIADADVDSSDIYNFIYGFYSPDDSVNLDDIYVCLEYDSETEAGDEGLVYKIAVSSVSYFNGLGFCFWNPYDENESGYTRSPLLVNDYGSVAIANGNQGVFQTFFRKAFNIQLPTNGAGSHTINEALAT